MIEAYRLHSSRYPAHDGTGAAVNGSAVLIVPSAVMPLERNYVLNVLHPDFRKIAFGQSEPFPFDPRLK